MTRATAHVRSFWKFFHFVNQFSRPARKNGHPVLFAIFEITISSQPRTQGILLPVSENGPGIGWSHDLKISSIWGVQL
jgi:hypothetical protein